jgi:hypothetical protein
MGLLTVLLPVSQSVVHMIKLLCIHRF